MIVQFLKYKLQNMKNNIKKEYAYYVFSKHHNCHLGNHLNFTGDLSRLSVGQNSTINGYANFRFSKGKIDIGKDCLLARNVTIITQSYELDNTKKISSSNMFVKDVVIGDGAWIGSNVIIMPGVIIGEYSVIGAGSVVTKNVGRYEIWAGNPAKKIRSRRKDNE